MDPRVDVRFARNQSIDIRFSKELFRKAESRLQRKMSSLKVSGYTPKHQMIVVVDVLCDHSEEIRNIVDKVKFLDKVSSGKIRS